MPLAGTSLNSSAARTSAIEASSITACRSNSGDSPSNPIEPRAVNACPAQSNRASSITTSVGSAEARAANRASRTGPARRISALRIIAALGLATVPLSAMAIPADPSRSGGAGSSVAGSPSSWLSARSSAPKSGTARFRPPPNCSRRSIVACPVNSAVIARTDSILTANRCMPPLADMTPPTGIRSLAISPRPVSLICAEPEACSNSSAGHVALSVRSPRLSITTGRSNSRLSCAKSIPPIEPERSLCPASGARATLPLARATPN